jgi:acid phosphatase (class A)
VLLRVLFALPVAALAFACAHADTSRIRLLEGSQVLATMTPAQQNEDIKGYLATDPASIAALMPPPPADGSQAAKDDLEMFHAFNDHPSTERWQTAVGDDLTVYDRFSEQLGLPLDRLHLPSLVRLLNRASADALAVTAEAKKRFPRPRPYQVMQLKRVCGMPKAPSPQKGSIQGASYPSGHAVVSWVAALVMSESAPASAQAIVGRAVSYGDSRVVCGLHFPSDVEAGHKLASAIVARLFENPDFVRDLKCARREVEAVTHGEKAEDLPACQG